MRSDKPAGADILRSVPRRNQQRSVRAPRIDVGSGNFNPVIGTVNGFRSRRRRTERGFADVGQIARVRRGVNFRQITLGKFRRIVSGDGFSSVGSRLGRFRINSLGGRFGNRCFYCRKLRRFLRQIRYRSVSARRGCFIFFSCHIKSPFRTDDVVKSGLPSPHPFETTVARRLSGRRLRCVISTSAEKFIT